MFKVTIKTPMQESGVVFRHFTTIAEAENFARPFIGSKDHDVQIINTLVPTKENEMNLFKLLWNDETR